MNEAGVTGVSGEIKSLVQASSPQEVPSKIESLDKLCSEYHRLRGQSYDEIEYKVTLLRLMDSETLRDIQNPLDPEDVSKETLKKEVLKKARANVATSKQGNAAKRIRSMEREEGATERSSEEKR